MCTEAYSDVGRKSKGNPKFTSSLGRLNKGYLYTLKRSCIWSMFEKRRTFFIKKVLCLFCRGAGNYAQSMTHPLSSLRKNVMSCLGIIKMCSCHIAPSWIAYQTLNPNGVLSISVQNITTTQIDHFCCV